MTIATVALPRVVAAPRAAVGRWRGSRRGRMLRHPAPWLGLLLSGLWLQHVRQTAWSSARYEGLLRPSRRCCSGCRWPACRRSAASTCRCRTTRRWVRPPLRSPAARRAALVGLVALVVVAASVWLRCAAGSSSATSRAAPRMRTTPCPSCCSRCCSAASPSPSVRRSCTSCGSAWRRPSSCSFWFLVGGTYWMFNGTSRGG